MCDSTASESRRCLPMRWISTSRGTLPARKPGILTRSARSWVACSTAWCTSLAGTSTVRRTRSPSSCSSWASIGEPLNQERAVSRSRGSLDGMDVEQAIRGRRTHKVFERKPVDRATVEELLELAGWAPNHHLTEPWRFRVIGPETFERLVAAGAPSEASKLGRAPTLVAATVAYTRDEHQNREDLLATACAVYAVLLAAHARGLASYWRTPALFETDAAREALGLEPNEEFVGLIHLGRPGAGAPAKERKPPAEYVTFLP